MSHGGLCGGGGESWNIKNVSLLLFFYFRSGMILIRLLKYKITQYEEESDLSLAGKRELYQDLSVKTNINDLFKSV